MLVSETSRNTAAQKLWPQGDCYADAELPSAAPNENGYVVKNNLYFILCLFHLRLFFRFCD